jgi:hypothetical protein
MPMSCWGICKSRTRGNRLRFFARHRDCRLFSAPVEIDIVRAAGSDDVASEDFRASMRVMRAVSIIAVLLLPQ